MAAATGRGPPVWRAAILDGATGTTGVSPVAGGSQFTATASIPGRVALPRDRRTGLHQTLPDWPPCETSVNVMFWFGVAPTNLFAVATASDVPSAEGVAAEVRSSVWVALSPST